MSCCSGSWNPWGEWLPADLCADLRDDSSCSCGRRHGHCDCQHSQGWDDRSGCCGDSGSDSGWDGHDGNRRKRKAIRVGNVSVDCTPVTFRTPGQAINVVSCPVSQVVNVPVTQTTNVQVPLPNGCIVNIPQTSQVQVPVVTTVNVPPVQTPAPTFFCPPGVTPFGGF